ncbi:MAG: hypothetical protein HUU29_05435 [Planctomycetaceae bacterium]|nr:hypothetical protein [Planctomycetaceae bacterium]
MFIMGVAITLVMINHQLGGIEHAEKLGVLKSSGLLVDVKLAELNHGYARTGGGRFGGGGRVHRYTAKLVYDPNPFQSFTRTLDLPETYFSYLEASKPETVKALVHPNIPSFMEMAELLDWRIEQAETNQTRGWIFFSLPILITILGAGVAVGAIIRIRQRRAEFDNDLIRRRHEKGLNALKNQNESGFPPARE